MKQRHFILLIILWMSPLAYAQEQQRLEVGISGMSCKFCAHNVEKNLSNLDGIKKASVDLEKAIVHIVMAPGKQGDVKQIQKLILKAGFTPLDVRVVKSIQ